MFEYFKNFGVKAMGFLSKQVQTVRLSPDDPTTGHILRIGHCPSFSALKDFEMDKVHNI